MRFLDLWICSNSCCGHLLDVIPKNVLFASQSSWFFFFCLSFSKFLIKYYKIVHVYLCPFLAGIEPSDWTCVPNLIYASEHPKIPAFMRYRRLVDGIGTYLSAEVARYIHWHGCDMIWLARDKSWRHMWNSNDMAKHVVSACVLPSSVVTPALVHPWAEKISYETRVQVFYVTCLIPWTRDPSHKNPFKVSSSW